MRLRIIINMKFLSSITATIDVPIKVADQYNHKFPTDPESSAGSWRSRWNHGRSRDKSMKKNISNLTIPPTIRLKPLSFCVDNHEYVYGNCWQNLLVF